MSREVIVVGGGTVGNYAAYQLAKQGIDVIVFEENKEIGIPQHCSGLVSISGLKRIGVYDHIRREGLIENKIRVAKFIDFSASITKVISFPRPVAVVIDRIGYDKLLYEKAIDAGAEYFLGSKVYDLDKRGIVNVRTPKGLLNFKTEVLVDAEGAKRSLIRKYLKNTDYGLLPALQIDFKADRALLDGDGVELHFNVDDFFSWIIPISEQEPIFRVGVASGKILNHHRLVNDLARKRLGKVKEIRRFGGLVVSSGPLKRYVFEKLLLVGDAAGHVKPTTGGGIVFGSIGALIASRIIKKHLNGGLNLKFYQKYYDRLLSVHYRLMKLVRKTMNFVGVVGAQVVLSLIPQAVFSNIRSDMDLQADAIIRVALPFINFLSRS